MTDTKALVDEIRSLDFGRPPPSCLERACDLIERLSAQLADKEATLVNMGDTIDGYEDQLAELQSRLDAAEKSLTEYKGVALEMDKWRGTAHEERARCKSLQSRLDDAEKDARRLDWLEAQYTLHKEAEIWYVVDGYQINLTEQDGRVRVRSAEGATLRAAIDAALQGKS
jgi:DNA repair ATPase RecN